MEKPELVSINPIKTELFLYERMCNAKHVGIVKAMDAKMGTDDRGHL